MAQRQPLKGYEDIFFSLGYLGSRAEKSTKEEVVREVVREVVVEEGEVGEVEED